METNGASIQKDRDADHSYDRMVELWTLRLMLSTLGKFEFQGGRGRQHEYVLFETVLEMLGLKDLLKPEADAPTIRSFLAQRLRSLEQDLPAREGALFRNLAGLAQRIGLNRVEEDLVAFAVLLIESEVMKTCSAEFPGCVSGWQVIRVLAEVLGYAVSEIQQALHRDGILRTTGLLSLPAGGASHLISQLDILQGLDRVMLIEDREPATILEEYVKAAPPTGLELSSFPHVQEDLRWIRRMLKEAMKEGTKGVNILIYGAPGVGKTELVRALAADLNVRLYEVDANSAVGGGGGDHGRFRAFQFCQAMLSGDRGSLILFDEIEDAFPTAFELLSGSSRTSQSKAWINKTLEKNPVPAFWLSNEVRQIDPAFLRRFTYVLEIPNPPESVRRGILKTELQGLPVREQWIGTMAREPRLTPAHIQRMATLARLSGVNEPGEAEDLMRRALRNSLDALGESRSLPQVDNLVEYSLDFLNATPDVRAIVEGLLRRPIGRLCLYGPPGTGKTALAQYLAQRLDKPLLKRTASELLSKWVGGTEKAFASMFRRAETERAVLLLDEADSFLYDRRTAQQSWEVTQVNELLVQMEAFDGLFICSTNLMDTLDPAVLRRFDLKIRFDYLRREQASALFTRALAAIGDSGEVPGTGANIDRELARFTNLTPGDFAVTIRRARLVGVGVTAEWLLAALEEESRAKRESGRSIPGFVS